MPDPIMLICDCEAEYAVRLSECLMNKEDLCYEIAAYTDPVRAVAYMNKQHVDMLIAEKSAFMKMRKADGYDPANFGECILLTEDREDSDESDCRNEPDDREDSEGSEGLDSSEGREDLGSMEESAGADVPKMCIYKYQPVTQILQKVFGDEKDRLQHEKTQITGIYSPLCGIGKTSYAMVLSALLAQKEKVLYLCLGCNTGISQQLGLERDHTFSELLYEFAATGAEVDLEGYYKETDGFYTIVPMDSLWEMQSVSSGQWVRLLRVIAQRGSFDRIILDINDVSGCVGDLLCICDEIKVLTKTGELAESKVEQFKNSLERYDKRRMLGKLVYEELPYLPEQSDTYVGLIYSPLGKILMQRYGRG